VVVAATYSARLFRYWLQGPKAGTLEKFVDLPAAPDSISRGEGGTFWVSLVSGMPPAVMFAIPRRWVRWLVPQLPKALAPVPEKIGMVVQLDKDGEVLRFLQDPDGEVVSFITAVNEYNSSRILLGTLTTVHQSGTAFFYDL